MRPSLLLACGAFLAAVASGTCTAQTSALMGSQPDPIVRPAPAPMDADGMTAASGGHRPVSAAPFVLAQGTRDALFGTDPLVADVPADKPKHRLSGFVEGLGAYTYGEPSHWSRAVGRLQLVAQGELAAGVKWKLGGRVDVDPVYFSSNAYPDAVKRDQRLDFFHRENYLDFSHGGWEFRLGAQQIVWGEVVGLFFADVVSARDMREFLLPSFDVIRIPQWAARAEYFHNDAHVELVWIPVPLFDRIGKPGSEFYPAPLPSPLPTGVAELFRDPERPDRDLGNSNYGVRANTIVAGWDISGFYYRSFSTQPTFYREATDDPGLPFVFQPRYDRIWQAGGTLSKDLGEMVLRGEVVYTHGQGFSLADLSRGNGVVKRSTLDYILGLEWVLPRETRLNVQAFQRVTSGGQDDLAIRVGEVGASLYVTTKLTSTLEPQLIWIQYLNDGGGLIRPRMNWHAEKNLVVSVGVDVFTGAANGFFGRFNDRDRAYAEVRYSF